MSYRSNWGRTHHPDHDADPGDCTDAQLELDMPKQCVCGATKPNLCVRDADLRWAAEAPTGRRPKTCLRRVDPATAPFPKGF